MFYLEENISLNMGKIRYNGVFFFTLLKGNVLMWCDHIQGNKSIVIY